MPDQSQEAAPVTVVARFVLTDSHKGDTAAFEEAFDGYRDYMTTQAGFRRTLLMRSPHHPDRYVIITEWRDTSAYKAAVMVPDFLLITASGLMELADLVNDHGTVLAAAAAADSAEGDDRLYEVTSHAPREGVTAEELQAGLLAGFDAESRRPGFVSGSVIASARRKGGYVSLVCRREPSDGGSEGEVYAVVSETSAGSVAGRAV